MALGPANTSATAAYPAALCANIARMIVDTLTQEVQPIPNETTAKRCSSNGDGWATQAGGSQAMARAMDEFFDGEVAPTQHQHRSDMQQQSSTQLVPQQLESRSPPTQQQQAVQQSSLGSGLEQADAVVQQRLGGPSL